MEDSYRYHTILAAFCASLLKCSPHSLHIWHLLWRVAVVFIFTNTFSFLLKPLEFTEHPANSTRPMSCSKQVTNHSDSIFIVLLIVLWKKCSSRWPALLHRLVQLIISQWVILNRDICKQGSSGESYHNNQPFPWK